MKLDIDILFFLFCGATFNIYLQFNAFHLMFIIIPDQWKEEYIPIGKMYFHFIFLSFITLFFIRETNDFYQFIRDLSKKVVA